MRAARRARIVGGADLRQGRCLEIGPLANPVVSPEVADVRYVDVVDRFGLVAHYAGDPAVDPDAIPEQHFWLTRPDGTVSTLAEAVAADAPYQHVVASHVIEHVPDMIGWLRDVAEVLTWDGVLLLAVPDRRYCFDVHRTPATVGQVVQAHLDGDRTPSVRAVLDHFMRAVEFGADQAWAGESPPTQPAHPLDDVRRHLARQQAGEYVDCHVWPLTPHGFADLLDDLLALGSSTSPSSGSAPRAWGTRVLCDAAPDRPATRPGRGHRGGASRPAPPQTAAAAGSSACAMLDSRDHTSARVRPEPTNANQNGAASPHCSAITPPIT